MSGDLVVFVLAAATFAGLVFSREIYSAQTQP